jgi:type IV pilus assembly protein PilE
MIEKLKGFTLVELMIVLGILALLVSLAYPSYVSFVRKGRRAEAQETLLDWASELEIRRADEIDYNDAGLTPDDTTYYTFTIGDLTATTYTLTATATAASKQTLDKQGQQDCSIISVNESGDRADKDNATASVCWRQH